jgi:hypothetical protein
MRTHVVNIFCTLCQAIRQGQNRMRPRSATDKEHFAEDWFRARLQTLGIPFQQQGRNRYPDFWVGPAGQEEGYELKALAIKSKNGQETAARKDLDFNSTIPSGQKEGKPVFLVFFLYQKADDGQTRQIHTLSVAHADLLNADPQLADEHLNFSLEPFGSFGDGRIRNRKMYIFPHPLTLNPGGLGRQRLLVPETWQLNDERLRKVDQLQRTLAPQIITSYTISLSGAQKGKAQCQLASRAQAGEKMIFDIFEMR